MKMPSVMTHAFSRVPSANIPRSSFDRSHGYKTTLDAANLYPIFMDEALPGDTFSVNMTGFARLSTPLRPVMDNAYFNTFFFAVPNRLLWDNWQRFNGEQTTPGDSTDFLVPEMVSPVGGHAIGSLSDYLGIPTGVAGLRHSALWHRAYALIWNEWFRDENLQDPIPISTGDGPDLDTAYIIKQRGKRHDYFTSCLPWPQKGESVSIPLGSTAPIGGYSFAYSLGTTPATSNIVLQAHTNGDVTAQGPVVLDGDSIGVLGGQMFADLTNASAATINQLRQAFQIQKLYERDARGGTRYTEILRSHFGVVSPDARLQRPEYLGGGQSPVNISPVPQMSATGIQGGETPQGNLGAYGTSVMHGHGFSKSFTEHCILIGLVMVRADLNYQQGLNRMFSRRSRFDYYWPALAHIGEQAVLSKEIYADGTVGDEDVFGYQERYAEYRYKPSIITGEMRSSAPQSLDSWHLALDFAQRPTLNASFIKEQPPFARVVAVPDEPTFIADFYFKMRCVRPMPVYGVPGMIDHF